MATLDEDAGLPMADDAIAAASTSGSTMIEFADYEQPATSFVTSDASTKISEGSASLFSTFGDSASSVVSKLGANLPSFDKLKAGVLSAGSTLFGGTGTLVSQQIASDAAKLNGSISASSLKASTSTVNTTDHIFTLEDPNGRLVEFNVMPEVSEARTVQYEAVAPAQFPGSFQKYKGTDSTQWTLNCTLITRTSAEADLNLFYLNTLRGWTMPYFGVNTGVEYPTKLGAPPPVLTMSGLRNVIGPVPTVITNLSWSWPKDVDYLPTTAKKPFPAVMNITINLVESFSTSQFNKFSLSDFRNGDMEAAYNTTTISTSDGNSVPDITANDTTTPAITDTGVSGDSIRTSAVPAVPAITDTGVSGDSIRLAAMTATT